MLHSYAYYEETRHDMFTRLQSYFTYLTSDPAGFIVYMLYLVGTVLFSLIIHEVAHGYVALRCGDPTAKWMGRLSLDPRKHLDPIGTICMFVLGFGWAKPVPVNPRNFSNYRRDDFLVSIAGICTNLTVFILCVALSVGVNRLMWQPEFYQGFHDYYGTVEYLVNPHYTVGYAIMQGDLEADVLAVMAQPWLRYVQRGLLMLANINLSLAVFNLLPIPPLDGYHLLNDTLLRGRLQLSPQAFRITHLALMVLMFSGMLGGLLSKANLTLYHAVLNMFLMLTGGA